MSVKPILIAEFKENKETLHHTWKWFEEQWEMVKKFTIQFDSREITIHFLDPKFIGDGKGYLQLLSLPCAYCYLCNINRDEAQSTDRLNMPIGK